jgi:hypothetical protein
VGQRGFHELHVFGIVVDIQNVDWCFFHGNYRE